MLDLTTMSHDAYNVVLFHDILLKGKNTLTTGGKTYEYEVMQFTGLHDKNGREVFEGDIVEYDYSWRVLTWKSWDEGMRLDHIPYEWEKRRKAVEFRDGSFTLGYEYDLSDIAGVGGPENDRKVGYLVGRYMEKKLTHGNSHEESKDFIVIGNIYENPELIEKGV